MLPTVNPPLTLSMRIARFLLRLIGWRVVDNLPPTPKFVAVGAWHTTNWDFILAVLAHWGLGVKLNFIGKRELTDGKLGWLMKRLGVIGVDRSKSGKFVETIRQQFAERDELRIIVPAEGTRSKAQYWKTGFYYMALAANVPIAFAIIDAKGKRIGIDGYFYPTGDREQDLQTVKDYYQGTHGLKPSRQAEIAFRPPNEANDASVTAQNSS